MPAHTDRWRLISDDGTEWRIVAAPDSELALTQQEFLRHLQSDSGFREWFTRELLELTRDAIAVRFECAPFDRDRMDVAMRFVVVADSSLERRCNRSAFSEHFVEAPCATFENLGGDAVLVVPCPTGSNDIEYQHLLSFLQTADADQVDALWANVATAVLDRLEAHDRVWLSTAGDGVAWLHVRVDKRPKYFQYSPFRVGPNPNEKR